MKRRTIRLRVGVLNAQRGNRKMGRLRALIYLTRPALLIVAEAQDLGPLHGYLRLGAFPKGTWQAQDCAVYARADRFGHVSHRAVQGSDAVPGHPVQHERWYVSAVVHLLAHPDVQVQVLAVHGNAAIQQGRKVPESRGAKESARLFDAVASEVKLGQALWQRLVLVGGDFNVTTGTGWQFAPDELLPAECSMTFHGHALSGLAVPRGVKLRRLRALPAPGVAAPHRYVLAALEVALPN